MGIAHGDTKSGETDHPDVVVVITDGHDLLWSDAQVCRDSFQGTALRDLWMEELNDIEGGLRDVEFASKDLKDGEPTVRG